MARIIGCLDGIHRRRIRGWALDSVAPLRRLQVELVVESQGRIAISSADHYRADVYKSGLGDGYCGFSIDGAKLAEGSLVRVFCLRPHVELATASQMAGSKPPLERNGVILHLDEPVGLPCLTGWAKSRTSPEVRRHLVLRIGNRAICQQKATLYRAESVAGDSDGFHGFALPLPQYSEDVVIEDALTRTEFPIHEHAATNCRDLSSSG
jgi:hypothetical protein